MLPTSRVDPEACVSDTRDLHSLPSPRFVRRVDPTGRVLSRIPSGRTKLVSRGAGVRDCDQDCPGVVAAAGAEVHRDGRAESAGNGWGRGRDQPHRLLRLHLCRFTGLSAATRPQGQVHGQTGSLRLEGHRAHHAKPAAHPGGPRQRRRVVRRGLPAAEGGRARRRLPRGDDQPQLRDQGLQVGSGSHGDRRGRTDRPAHRVGRPARVDQGPPTQDVAAQGADLGRGRGTDPSDVARRRTDGPAAFADAAPARRGTGRLRVAPRR